MLSGEVAKKANGFADTIEHVRRLQGCSDGQLLRRQCCTQAGCRLFEPSTRLGSALLEEPSSEGKEENATMYGATPRASEPLEYYSCIWSLGEFARSAPCSAATGLRRRAAGSRAATWQISWYSMVFF